MLLRLSLYSTLGLVLAALGQTWDTSGFWCVVGLFWASEHLARIQLLEQIQREVEAIRKANKDATDEQ